MEYIKIAVLLCAGIYLGNRFSVDFAVIFIISLIMVLTVKAIFKRKFNIKILIAALIFAAGVVMFHWAQSDAIRDLTAYVGRYITVEGRISEIPSEKDGNVQYIIDVRTVMYDGDKKDVNGKLLLTAKSGRRYGESVIFSGFAEKIPEKMNSNGFDFSTYYKSKGIFTKMYSSDITSASVTFRDFSPYALGNRIRSFISYIIDENYKGDYGAIMKAVLTGNKKEFSPEFSRVLNRTGTSRFFYPAFLHVMLFITALGFILSALDKRRRDAATAAMLVIYAMFNMSGVVFLKLCIMLSLLIIMRYRYGYVYYLDVIGLTAIIIGLINPLLFFNAGFVMSMLSSVMIYYFYDSVSNKLKFIKVKYIRRLLSIGLICTVGLMPLSAYFFHGVNVWSIPASVVIIPCVALILILSPLLLIMLGLFKTGPIIGQAVGAALFVIKHLPYLMDRLRLVNTVLPSPDALFLLIYLFVVIAAVKYVKNKKSDMRIALFVAAALTVSAAVQPAARLNDAEITFVNVGQGDGALIRAPYRYNILIDGGGGNAYSDYNPGEKIFLEYLLAEGITKVDSAFVSHYHKDHVQGIIAAVENIKVRNLFLPDNMEGSEWREALENAAREHNTKIHYISEETLLTYNNGMTLRIIPPAKKTEISKDENDTTYVYRIEYGDFSAVFTGDMTKFAENCLVETGRVEEADLLKVAHHGSDTSTSDEWLGAVNPKYAVISVGEDNTYALPHENVIERLSGAKLYRTDLDGDIRFTAEKNGKIKIETGR